MVRNLVCLSRARLFENRALRRTFGPKREEVEGGWRRLYNEELYNLYSSQNIIRVIKSRSMRGARMGNIRNTYKVLVEIEETSWKT
jgi:hypothetical protein